MTSHSRLEANCSVFVQITAQYLMGMKDYEPITDLSWTKRVLLRS